MTFRHAWCLVLFALALLFHAQVDAQESKAATRFEAVEIYVDSGMEPLAAYQIEFRVKNNRGKIVGIEGGSHPAFEKPPYYDPKAIQNERVIIAAFNTAPAKQLPTGNTRIATIHLQLNGMAPADYEIHLKTAANPQGKKIPAKATIKKP